MRSAPAVVATSLFLCLTGCSGPSQETLTRTIEHQLGASENGAFEHADALQRLYTERSFEPVWVDGEGPTERFDELIRTLCDAVNDGLWPAAYLSPDLDAALERTRSGTADSDSVRSVHLAQLDIQATQAYLRYAHDLLTGRVDPRQVGAGWNAPVHEVDLAAEVADTTGGGVRFDLDDAVARRHETYAELRDALRTYRQLAARGGWTRIPEGPSLARGDEGERVALLRQRLRASGDLSEADTSTSGPARFDDTVAAAVARFQARHGLEPDSVAGEAVITAMNVPADARVRQLALNLERWRWIPSNLGSRYLYVNVPAFELHAFEGDREALSMRVVVGQEYDDQATPVFSDTMQYVVFSPYWNVPESIANEEIVPAARENRNYLAQNDYEIVRSWTSDEAIEDPGPDDLDRVEEGTYRIRQRPGRQNALGRIKFMFPNAFNIYLHDTPADHLFQRADRAYSHGCIRVEDPVALARFALEGTDLSEDDIRNRMAGDDEQAVNLAQPLPVYILYWTAFVEDGAVHFRRDLYGQDAALDSALAEVRPPEEETAGMCTAPDG